jgi:hypothetical protein
MVWAATAFALLASSAIFRISGIARLSVRVALEETRRPRAIAILTWTAILLFGFLGALLGAKVADGEVELAGFALMTCSVVPVIWYASKNPPQP